MPQHTKELLQHIIAQEMDIEEYPSLEITLPAAFEITDRHGINAVQEFVHDVIAWENHPGFRTTTLETLINRKYYVKQIL